MNELFLHVNWPVQLTHMQRLLMHICPTSNTSDFEFEISLCNMISLKDGELSHCCQVSVIAHGLCD